jgi:hypothetical protein
MRRKRIEGFEVGGKDRNDKDEIRGFFPYDKLRVRMTVFLATAR